MSCRVMSVVRVQYLAYKLFGSEGEKEDMFEIHCVKLVGISNPTIVRIGRLEARAAYSWPYALVPSDIPLPINSKDHSSKAMLPKNIPKPRTHLLQ